MRELKLRLILVKSLLPRRTLPRVRELKRWQAACVERGLRRTLPRVRELKRLTMV